MPEDAPRNDRPQEIERVLREHAPDLLRDIEAAAPGTRLIGLVGAGLQRSRTPAMHEREAAALGFPLLYRRLDLDVLRLPAGVVGDLMAWAEGRGFAGLNVTHPCKQVAFGQVGALSDDARAIGAINTVVFRGGACTGYNTDCSGFAESFRREGAAFTRRRVVLLGAGGAGAAVARALLLQGAVSLAIHDPVPQRSEELAGRLCAQFGAGRARSVADLASVAHAADGLVNATPVGTDAHPGLPLDTDLLRPRMWVADINYFRTETDLLAAARRIGCRTIAGKGMAVFQAAHAFELFTGRQPDVERMARSFEAG